MKKSFLAVGLSLLLACAGVAHAQGEKPADELGPVAEWVLKDGLKKTLDDEIALRLGMGEANVAIRHKGYRTTSDNMRHAFQIATKGNVIVLELLDAKNNGMIWRTTRAGVLLMTLRRDGDKMKVEPNSHTAKEFEAEKQYFLSKIPVVARH